MAKVYKLISLMAVLTLILAVAPAALAYDAVTTGLDPVAHNQEGGDQGDDMGGVQQEPQQGQQEDQPTILPQTGGVANPWVSSSLFLVAGGLILAGGLGLALVKRGR